MEQETRLTLQEHDYDEISKYGGLVKRQFWQRKSWIIGVNFSVTTPFSTNPKSNNLCGKNPTTDAWAMTGRFWRLLIWGTDIVDITAEIQRDVFHVQGRILMKVNVQDYHTRRNFVELSRIVSIEKQRTALGLDLLCGVKQRKLRTKSQLP